MPDLDELLASLLAAGWRHAELAAPDWDQDTLLLFVAAACCFYLLRFLAAAADLAWHLLRAAAETLGRLAAVAAEYPLPAAAALVVARAYALHTQ